ncbi:hypothetical protein GOC74_12105 [Halomicrobium mukohataei]|uniref:Uncharacterized protein n=1 Tax=Halomicrobium mukohataei TaxID=57705 RepID=A0A847UHT9_9EURY|nr:hypothetical protein [Halomicrobium mukohataei]NLV10668.1 hypothetical protein [Halomicrobium mukohataei]
MSESERPHAFRPALVTLSNNVRERFDELLTGGLRDEDRVLTWLQEMTMRTLGRVDARVYWDFARQFRGTQGLLVAAMVRPCARQGKMRSLDEDVAEKLRERLLANYFQPAHVDAFRRLRHEATEYVSEAEDESEHDPTRQSYLAMRPAMSELDEWQERALASLLDGFESRSAILDWGDDLLLATHGELGREWTKRAYEEEPTVEVLTGAQPEHERARRLFAAHHVLPKFRAGVRALSGDAGEMPENGQHNDTEPPDW